MRKAIRIAAVWAAMGGLWTAFAAMDASAQAAPAPADYAAIS